MSYQDHLAQSVEDDQRPDDADARERWEAWQADMDEDEDRMRSKGDDDER